MSLILNCDMVASVPHPLRGTLLCFAYVNSGAVSSAPDIATCQSNGYLYEVKKRNIVGSLDLTGEKASSISSYYVPERDGFVLFYLIFTKTHKLLVIRSFNKRLQVVRTYQDVQKYDVFDFKCMGYPQIMISTRSLSEKLVEFPVEEVREMDVDKGEYSSDFNSISNSLEEKLQVVNKHTDELTEEYENLRIMCTPVENDYSGIVPIGRLRFSSGFREMPQGQVTIISKWFRVFGGNLILGMRIRNTGEAPVRDPEVTVNHPDVEEYACRFFPLASRVPEDLFAPLNAGSCLAPGEEVVAAVAFPVPAFAVEARASIPCHVTCRGSSSQPVREVFQVSVLDVARQHSHLLETEFTWEDWMSVLTAKVRTVLEVRTEDVDDDEELEALLRSVGFRRIDHVKDKLFYCTSKYLSEAFLAFRRVAATPSLWRISLHTRDDRESCFLMSALYELLPENTMVVRV